MTSTPMPSPGITAISKRARWCAHHPPTRRYERSRHEARTCAGNRFSATLETSTRSRAYTRVQVVPQRASHRETAMLGYKRGPGVASRRAAADFSHRSPEWVVLNRTRRGWMRAVRSLSEPRCPRRGASPASACSVRPLIARAGGSARPADATGSRRARKGARSHLPSRRLCVSPSRARFRARSAAQPILTPAAPDAAPGQPRWLMVDGPPRAAGRLRLPRGGLQRRRARLGEGGDPNGADIPLSVPGMPASISATTP